MTAPQSDSPDLRAALDKPENLLARALGKARLGRHEGDGYYFVPEAWAFLVDAVAQARAALAAAPPAPVLDAERLARALEAWDEPRYTTNVHWPAAAPVIAAEYERLATPERTEPK